MRQTLPSSVDSTRGSSLWKKIEEILEANYDHPDLQAAKVVCAGVAAHRIIEHPPAWELLIAPSGSMKTDLLESLRGLPRVHFVDEVTPNTFISGKLDEGGRERKRPASYLHRLGNDAILVAADFSTVTAPDKKALALILSQLRRIYDGNYSRQFGTEGSSEEHVWAGRLTLLAGATPSVDTQYSVFQALGERFVRLRWPRAGGVEAGIKALHHTTELAAKLRQAVGDLLLPILSLPAEKLVVPVLPGDMEVRIASLTEFVALARTTVPRERSTHEISAQPAPEGNTRLPQELAQIGRGSALLCGRTTVNEEDFALIERGAFDCLPPTRRQVLEALMRGKCPYSSAPANALVARAIEDLELVGLVSKDDGGKYELTAHAKALLQGAIQTGVRMAGNGAGLHRPMRLRVERGGVEWVNEKQSASAAGRRQGKV